MKLLAFVLLGFLAHSCSGTCQTSHKQFQNEVCDTFADNFEDYEGCNLLPFTIPNLGQIIASVTGLVSLQTDLQYQSDNKYNIIIGGTLSLNSPSITGLDLSIHVTGQLDVSVNKGCRELNLIEASLEIKIEVGDQAVFLGVGVVLGDITGIAKKTIIDSFTSNCQQSLPGKIVEMIQCSLTSYNAKYQSTTTPVYSNGNWFNAEISNIECTADSLVEYVNLAIRTATDAEATTVSLGNEVADILEEGVGSSICFTEESIDAIVNVALDYVISGCEKTITNAEWQEYGKYIGIEGDFTVTAKRTKKTSCSIQSSESSVSVSLGFEVSDDTGHSFLEFGVEIDIAIALSRRNGITALSLGETITIKKSVTYEDVGCGCEDDDDLLDSFEELIEDTVGDVIDALTCALDEGLPCINSFTPTWPPESDCAGGDEVFTCHCPYY